MQIRVISAGKPALAYAKLGIEEYLKRLRRLGGCTWEVVKAGDSASVSQRLLERSEGSFRLALDERGQFLSTRELAETLKGLEHRGDLKSVAFLIGAADGHTAELRERCNAIISLSRLTLQHDLALLVLTEQLYRVASLRAGMPYHRD